MKKNKYYTPKDEEFHRGFRFEMPNRDGEPGSWKLYAYKHTPGANFDIDELCSHHQKTMKELVRVKYLNQDDIEELGWEWVQTREIPGDDDLTMHTFMHYENVGNIFQLTLIGGSVKIIAKGVDASRNGVLFLGEIKNYNELERVMFQVGILRYR